MTNIKSKHIQILRGMAIIAVVLIHTAPAGTYQVFLRPFFNFSVGLFLFLSGMLSDALKWNPRKRITKVIIPYIIWTLIYVVLKNINSPSVIPGAFIEDLITGTSAAMMYYILVYCEFTLLIPLIDKLAKSRFKYWGFAIAPIEIIVMRMLPWIIGYEGNKYISIIMSVSCLGWFTYFYLGYLMGNNIITVKESTKKLYFFLIASVFIQIAEGYWWLSMGNANCGTQLKLSSILTGVIFNMLAYRFVYAEKEYNNKILNLLGNYSFAIYFSHIAVIKLLAMIPLYSKLVFPLNSIIVIILDVILIFIGKKILGKHSKYLAL